MADTLYVKTESGYVKVEVGAAAQASRTVSVSDERAEDLPEGSSYAVTAHTVGKGHVSVFLDGLEFFDWEETSSTTIKFLIAIPKTMQIIVSVTE